MSHLNAASARLQEATRVFQQEQAKAAAAAQKEAQAAAAQAASLKALQRYADHKIQESLLTGEPDATLYQVWLALLPQADQDRARVELAVKWLVHPIWGVSLEVGKLFWKGKAYKDLKALANDLTAYLGVPLDFRGELWLAVVLDAIVNRGQNNDLQVITYATDQAIKYTQGSTASLDPATIAPTHMGYAQRLGQLF